jgi:hypothetical protein
MARFRHLARERGAKVLTGQTTKAGGLGRRLSFAADDWIQQPGTARKPLQGGTIVVMRALLSNTGSI